MLALRVEDRRDAEDGGPAARDRQALAGGLFPVDGDHHRTEAREVVAEGRGILQPQQRHRGQQVKLRLVDPVPLFLSREHRRILGQEAVAVPGGDAFACRRQGGDDLGAGERILGRVRQRSVQDRLHQPELSALDRRRQAGEQTVRCERHGPDDDDDRSNDCCRRAAPECHAVPPESSSCQILCELGPTNKLCCSVTFRAESVHVMVVSSGQGIPRERQQAQIGQFPVALTLAAARLALQKLHTAEHVEGKRVDCCASILRTPGCFRRNTDKIQDHPLAMAHAARPFPKNHRP